MGIGILIMNDFSQLRNKITHNYLKSLLIRIDFEDIIEFANCTKKELTNNLRECGYKDYEGVVNELNLSITLKDNSFRQSNSLESRKAFVFVDENDEVRIEITPSAILLLKYNKFEEYEGLDKYKQIFLRIFEIINKHEKIYMKRINLKKIDTFEVSNIDLYKDIFEDFITCDFTKNPYTDNVSKIAKVINFFEKGYFVNYINRLFQGTFFVKNKLKDGYQFLIEVETYKDINSNEKVLLDSDITTMNNILFNIFMASFTEQARKKIANNIPLIEERDE